VQTNVKPMCKAVVDLEGPTFWLSRIYWHEKWYRYIRMRNSGFYSVTLY